MGKTERRLLCALVAAPLLLTGAPDAVASEPAAKTLKFVFSRPKEHKITQGLIRVYTEALKRMGLGFKFVDVPTKRAGKYSNAGHVDGELSRTHDYGIANPNLVRVEEPNYVISFGAYMTNPTISIKSWQELETSNYRVICRHGVKKCNVRLPELIAKKRLVRTTNQIGSVRMLTRGRGDVLIEVERSIRPILNGPGFDEISNGKQVHLVGQLESISAHAWLHKRHADLAPRLAQVIREMKRDGSFQELRGGAMKVSAK